MLNSVWKSSTSSPVLPGLFELYFVAPLAETVNVTLCGVNASHTRVKEIDAPAEEFWSAFWARSVRPAGRTAAGNSSANRIMLARFILRPLGSGYWWQPCECGRWQWPARQMRPWVLAAPQDSTAA